ncbi:MAG: hypothetical protein WC359_14815 [Dehalococcoidia bacterium]|jgi:hypothetical protein
MAYQIPPYTVIGTLKVPASTAWAGYQFRAVGLDESTAGYIRLPNSSLGNKILGILQNKPGSGQAATVWPIGSGAVSKILGATTTITFGDLVWFTSLGFAKSSTAAVANTPLFGPVLETCTSTGAPISCVLQHIKTDT